MKRTEKQVSEHLKPKLGAYFRVHSFEASRNQATPDLYLVEFRHGHSIWVELKVEETGKVEFQPGQCQWLEQHDKCGGLGYVMVYHPQGGGILALYAATDARWLSTCKDVRGNSKAIFSGDYRASSTIDLMALRMMQDADDKWGRS